MCNDKPETASSSDKNPMKETKPPVMPTTEHRDGGDKTTRR